jgi:hypothetical protein
VSKKNNRRAMARFIETARAVGVAVPDPAQQQQQAQAEMIGAAVNKAMAPVLEGFAKLLAMSTPAPAASPAAASPTQPPDPAVAPTATPAVDPAAAAAPQVTAPAAVMAPAPDAVTAPPAPPAPRPASAPNAPAMTASPANMFHGVRDYLSLSDAELAALQPGSGQARAIFEAQINAINRVQGAPPRPQAPSINGANHVR